MSSQGTKTVWALFWKELATRGEPVDERAVKALEYIAGHDIPALAELRCQRRGHLLSSVHGTRYGLLLWNVPPRRWAPSVQREAQKIPKASDKPVGPRSLRLLGFESEMLSSQTIDLYPLPCRCGVNSLDIHALFEAARAARTAGHKEVLRAEPVAATK